MNSDHLGQYNLVRSTKHMLRPLEALPSQKYSVRHFIEEKEQTLISSRNRIFIQSHILIPNTMKSSEAAIKEIARRKGNSANQIISNRLIHWKKSSEQR